MTSSATLQELADIQYSSFNGSVHFDESSSHSGCQYPSGTACQPTNNLFDAIKIAYARGYPITAIGDEPMNPMEKHTVEHIKELVSSDVVDIDDIFSKNIFAIHSKIDKHKIVGIHVSFQTNKVTLWEWSKGDNSVISVHLADPNAFDRIKTSAANLLYGN
jgi:hypothetical protein